MAKQAKTEPNGFNVADANKRLENWFTENVAAPVGTDLAPAERTAAIRMLAMDYWLGHARRPRREDEGQVQRLCVALALLEICAHEVTLREAKEADAARQVGAVTGISTTCSPALALEDEVAASPLSRTC